MPLRPDMDYRDYLDVLGRRKWLVVVAFLVVFSGAGAYLLFTTPLYKSTTTILVIPQQMPYSQPPVNRRFEDRLATIEQQITSRTRLMQVREELGLLASDRKKQLPEEVYEKMRERVELDVLEDTGSGRGMSGPRDGFSLSYMDKDPKLARLAASRLASLFIEENQKVREQQALRTSSFLESQLKEAKAKLDAHEEKIKKYKLEHMGELPQELQTNLATLVNLQEQYRVNADEIRATEQRKFLMQSQITMMERNTQTVVHQDGREEVDTSRNAAQALVTELTNRRNQLAEMTAKYTDRHPDVVRLKQEVDQLEKKIAMIYMPPRTMNENEKGTTNRPTYLPLGGGEREEYLNLKAQIDAADSEIGALKRARETIKGKIVLLQSKIDKVPRREQELVVLTRDSDNLKNMYNDLLKKKLEANIAEDLEGRKNEDQFQILDPANLPEKPFKPKKSKVILVAFLLASGLGFGGAIALEWGDETLRSVKDFQHFFDLKVFACIPDIVEGDKDNRKTMQLGVILGGVLLFLAGVLALLWFYEEKIRFFLRI